ncbi:hypothetical protein N7532_002230 [Penicillium argentinense]|uniref:FAD-binding PCMH-type domain-containing protein n=1 Tax=Penicillium argentinense TaxID=1131581 RepID=A0A9W9G005_9EURO|nr:uncharacterized protein N7532_002230 [Penicillium argentinense]KAJ5109585.1 hypothetical protein N7532_002230 [Penicillium argentinense]
MDHVTQFLAQNTHIHHATPQSQDYEDLREQFIIQETRRPAIIIRPRSIEDISALISLFKAHDLPFGVRGGGHDMFGRTQVQDGITLDMRDISHVHVDKESQTVRIGGGVINMDLHRELQKHNVTTPHGVTPTVGFTGWAIHGGYGLLSSHYGVGADNIVGARVVDAQGQVRDADETMLTAIRGGGGSVAVVYELTVKVYPSDKILAGFYIYQSDDLAATIRLYNENYRKLKENDIPQALSIYQAVMNGPQGLAFVSYLVWSSSDLEEGQKWAEKVAALAPVTVNNVVPTTFLEFNELAASFIEKKTWGTIFCPGFYDLTPEVVNVIGTHTENRPNKPGLVFGIHELRREAPRENKNSVFNARDPHFLVEIIPMVSAEEGWEELLAWGQQFYDDLMKTDPANILSTPYLPLTSNERLTSEAVFGDRLEVLKKAKELYDPQNLFKHTIVQP